MSLEYNAKKFSGCVVSTEIAESFDGDATDEGVWFPESTGTNVTFGACLCGAGIFLCALGATVGAGRTGDGDGIDPEDNCLKKFSYLW